jgi:DNA-binding NarL/FixJ family response regulator
MNIRVLLADDQKAVRQGLRLRLELEADIEVVGEATDGEDAIALATALQPDVVVMDVQMPRLDGISAIPALMATAPHTAVVILSLHDDAGTLLRAQGAGADAFVAKHQADHRLPAAIRRAAGRNPDRGHHLGGCVS